MSETTETKEYQLPPEYENITIDVKITLKSLLDYIKQYYSEDYNRIINNDLIAELSRIFKDKGAAEVFKLIFDTDLDGIDLYAYIKNVSPHFQNVLAIVELIP